MIGSYRLLNCSHFSLWPHGRSSCKGFCGIAKRRLNSSFKGPKSPKFLGCEGPMQQFSSVFQTKQMLRMPQLGEKWLLGERWSEDDQNLFTYFLAIVCRSSGKFPARSMTQSLRQFGSFKKYKGKLLGWIPSHPLNFCPHLWKLAAKWVDLGVAEWFMWMFLARIPEYKWHVNTCDSCKASVFAISPFHHSTLTFSVPTFLRQCESRARAAKAARFACAGWWLTNDPRNPELLGLELSDGKIGKRKQGPSNILLPFPKKRGNTD